MRGPAAERNSLAGLASRALGWSFASNTTARIGTLPIGIVLARLLGPHSFGTFAVALVALMAVISFNDLGVSLAIVRWEGEPAEIAPTVASLSVASSLVIYAGCYLGAPAFASAMGAPAATGVIRVLTLNVIVDGVTATPAALMQRYFLQRRKMIADQVNNWLGVAVSVGLAWQGFGAMSLAVGRMSGAVASGVLFLVFSPEPVRFGLDRNKARALCRFGLPLAGASLVVFAVTNVDQLVVGHMLGATALGFYALALNLAAWPVTMFSLPTRAVAPAVFSRLQHDRTAMNTELVSAAGLLGSATLPICLLMSGAAVPLLGFVYGTPWVPAAHALIWLAMLGGLRILFELIYDFFVVLARTRVVFTIQVVWLAALVPALIAGAQAGGIGGAALAEVAVAGCVVMPWYLSELSKVGITRRSLAARLWLPVVAAAAVGGAAAAAARLIRADLAALAVGGVLALAAIGLLGLAMRSVLAALRADLGQRPAPGPVAAASASPAGPARLAATGGPAVAGGIAEAGGLATLTALPEAATFCSEVAEPALAPPSTASSLPAREGLAARGAPWDELVLLPAFPDLTGPLPVYRETVASLRWDPASGQPNLMRDSDAHHLEKP
jgi:O-antigen/teichoic acid export membrane protein